MILVAIFAIVLHLAGLIQAITFLRQGTCRNADRSIIAAMAVGSLALMAIQGGQVCALALGWGGHSPLDSFISAFALFNGVLYQGILHSYSEAREQRSIIPHPTKGTPT